MEEAVGRFAAEAAHHAAGQGGIDHGGEVLLAVATAEQERVSLKTIRMAEHGQEGGQAGTRGDEYARPSGLLELISAQRQLDDGTSPRLFFLDEPRPAPARARRDEQLEHAVLEAGDGVVAPRIVADMKTGELSWSPCAD